MLETEGWSPGCDVSALEYQAALRMGRMNAVPMPTYGYEKSNAATERLARRAAAEASALRGPEAASPPPTAEPAPSPAAKPAPKPKRHSHETASAAQKPSRPVAPDPAVPAVPTVPDATPPSTGAAGGGSGIQKKKKKKKKKKKTKEDAPPTTTEETTSSKRYICTGPTFQQPMHGDASQ